MFLEVAVQVEVTAVVGVEVIVEAEVEAGVQMVAIVVAEATVVAVMTIEEDAPHIIKETTKEGGTNIMNIQESNP